MLLMYRGVLFVTSIICVLAVILSVQQSVHWYVVPALVQLTVLVAWFMVIFIWEIIDIIRYESTNEGDNEVGVIGTF